MNNIIEIIFCVDYDLTVHFKVKDLTAMIVLLILSSLDMFNCHS